MVELRLLAEDGDAMLEIWQLDVRDHTPLKATNQTRLETRDFRRRPVAREHDLTTCFVERVEGVKELFLGRLFALEELHVVDEQQIRFAKASAELVRRAILNRADKLVGELLGADEGDARVGLPGKQLMSDGLHQVRLAYSRVAVNEERVVN